MGRFYKPAITDYGSYVFQLPEELIIQGVQRADQTLTAQKALPQAYRDYLGNVGALAEQEELRDQILADYDAQVNQMTKDMQANPFEYTRMNSKLSDLGHTIQKDVTRGNLASIQANYDYYNNKLAADKKRLEKEEITEMQLNSIYNTDMKKFKEAVNKAEGLDGAGVKLKIADIANYVDGSEYLIKNLKGMKVDGEEIEGFQTDKDGNLIITNGMYMVKTKQGVKGISADRIMDAAIPLLRGNDQYNSYLRQGIEYDFIKGKLSKDGKSLPEFSIEKDEEGNSYRKLNPEHAYYNAIMSAIGIYENKETTGSTDLKISKPHEMAQSFKYSDQLNANSSARRLHNQKTMAGINHELAKEMEAIKQDNKKDFEEFKKKLEEQEEQDEALNFSYMNSYDGKEVNAKFNYSGLKVRQAEERLEKAKDVKKQLEAEFTALQNTPNHSPAELDRIAIQIKKLENQISTQDALYKRLSSTQESIREGAIAKGVPEFMVNLYLNKSMMLSDYQKALTEKLSERGIKAPNLFQRFKRVFQDKEEEKQYEAVVREVNAEMHEKYPEVEKLGNILREEDLVRIDKEGQDFKSILATAKIWEAGWFWEDNKKGFKTKPKKDYINGKEENMFDPYKVRKTIEQVANEPLKDQDGFYHITTPTKASELSLDIEDLYAPDGMSAKAKLGRKKEKQLKEELKTAKISVPSSHIGGKSNIVVIKTSLGTFHTSIDEGLVTKMRMGQLNNFEEGTSQRIALESMILNDTRSRINKIASGLQQPGSTETIYDPNNNNLGTITRYNNEYGQPRYLYIANEEFLADLKVNKNVSDEVLRNLAEFEVEDPGVIAHYVAGYRLEQLKD